MMKKAFTLIEVNLAILVMAGGILSVVVLYSLGFRETRQSREDIISAATADAVFGPLVAALSSDQLTWDNFNSIESVPSGGWGGYINENNGTVRSGMNAASVYSSVMGKLGSSGVSAGFPSSAADGYVTGMVVCHEKDTGLVKIGFRAAKRKDALLSAPLYYTEVRFQGKQSVE